MTDWTNPVATKTTWTLGTTNKTSFDNRRVSNLGVLMNDTVYLMNDTVATINDDKLQNIYAPTTSWT
jgi:hypothetical protein